jgi:glycosyltransferase involved in cell wall biosynthesis
VPEITTADRVVVDARALQVPLTGIGRYVEALLEHMPAGMIGVARPSSPVEAFSLSVRNLRPDVWNVVWNDLCLRRVLRNADAFWSPVGHVPWMKPKRCLTVATIHDITCRTHPETMTLQRRLDLENSNRVSARRAEVLSTTCQFVSDQLKHYYGRAADLLLPPAPTLSAARQPAVDAMRERFAAAHPGVRQWVLGVGQEIPRKNFVLLADAVASLPGVGLVIAGPPADVAVAEALEARKASTPLIRLGYTERDELAAVYGAIDLLAFVSTFEAYGMPVLDARALGVRLVVSDVRPLVDHSGPNAVVVDLNDVDAMAVGIKRALDGPPPTPEPLPTWADSARFLCSALGLNA